MFFLFEMMILKNFIILGSICITLTSIAFAKSIYCEKKKNNDKCTSVHTPQEEIPIDLKIKSIYCEKKKNNDKCTSMHTPQEEIPIDLKIKNIYSEKKKNNDDLSISTPIPDISINLKERFSGLFFGIHGGFLHVSAKSRYINTNPILYCEPGNGGIETMSDNGELIGSHLVLGNFFSNNIYVGAEITTCYNFAKGSVQNETYFGKNVSYQLKDSYAAILRIGGLSGNTLVYGKSGIAFTHRIVNSYYPDLESPIPTYISKKYQRGFLVGFGTEIPLNEKFSLSLEAEYINYEADKISHIEAQNYNIKSNTFNMSFKISMKI